MTTPDHHVSLDGDWVLWKWVCLRGAGFPAVDVLRLAAPQSAAAADRLCDEEDRFEQLRQKMIETCRALGSGRALKKLLRGEVPAAPTGEAAIDEHLDELTRAQTERTTARQNLEQLLQAEQRAVSEAFRDIVGSPRFQEALLLQNRTAQSHLLRGLAQPTGNPNSQTRRREALVARYLQRYAVKNDSISFFGPVGWGLLTPSGPAVEARPGASLIARRLLFFEYWCIDTLASVLAQDERIRPQIAPRRMPIVRVTDSVLHLGLGRTAEVPVVFAVLLAACDGVRSAKAIAEELCAEPAHELSGPEEVYELLDELAEKKLVVWSLEIPTNDHYPERALRSLLDRLEPGDARSESLAKLDELEVSRTAVANAAGDPEALERALTVLDETFTRLTGAMATRRAGEMYAARTLVHEDCVRDIELSLGPTFIAALAPPLSLLLQSARWFTFELARAYLEVFEQAFTQLTAAHGEEIEYATFFSEIAPVFTGSSFETAPEPVRRVSQRLESHWAELLQFEPSARRIERTADELRATADRLFAAPHGGWPNARFHSPDLTVAAKSVEDIARGDFLCVMGELHVGMNLAIAPWTLLLHDDMQPLVAAMKYDMQLPQVAPVATRETIERTEWYSLVPSDFHVETGTARSSRARDQVLALGELIVVRHESKLVVRTRDGRVTFDLLAFLDMSLSTSCLQHFRMLPPTTHSPRITIDKLVVSRERWTFKPEDIAFPRLPSVIERFAGARRWARSLGVPRFAFYRTPEERKPLFVDFESPTYTEILAHQLRDASSLSISEMLPDVDHAWLPDREGNMYTCELRLTALDRAPIPAWYATVK